MSVRLRNLDREGDSEAERVLEAAFHRPERESRLARELARAHPDFDPRLALVAELEGRAVGCAVLLPRSLLVRGVSVPMVVLGPVGVDPAQRGDEIGDLLVRGALEDAARGGALGAVVLDARELFVAQGFASAFDLWGLRVSAELLAPGDTALWRGLAAEDLAGLMDLYGASYREVSGCERRSGAALDWESIAERAYTLVHPGAGRPLAYLRFRVREELELLECGARNPAGVEAVLAMLARLTREHARLALFARLPGPHPVARALFRRGALLERSNLGGAGMLRVLDWPALLETLAPVWEPALAGLEVPAMTLGIGEETWRLELEPAGPRVRAAQRLGGAHLALPTDLAPSLLTGQRGFEELWFEPAVREPSDLSGALRAALAIHLAPHAAMWCYAPPYELVDD